MIKKLRRRIILINMLLMGVVILGIFIAVNVNLYTSSVRDLEHSITQLLQKDEKRFNGMEGIPPEEDNPDEDDLPVRFGKQGNEDFAPMQISSYVIVTMDENGSITGTQTVNVTMDDEDVQACVKQATGKSGMIDEYSLMYVSRDMMGGRKTAFASNASVFNSLKNSLLISGLLFLVSLAGIFVISLFLSGLAVKPVKKAWQQQKQFVADASHELKTPLTVILANNNIMMSHPNSKVSDERQWLESTGEEAEHMKKLIDNMLFLAKSDANETKVQLSDVNFSEIAEGCALHFEPVAFEKEVLIDAEIEENVILRGDSTLLNQLARILIDNAVKYAEPNSTATIRLQKHGDHAEFSVNNMGAPISKEDLEHIFDRFYRAEKSRTTKGYGLGLSIAQRIVEGMNGKISVQSSAEDGTTFTVKF